MNRSRNRSDSPTGIGAIRFGGDDRGNHFICLSTEEEALLAGSVPVATGAATEAW